MAEDWLVDQLWSRLTLRSSSYRIHHVLRRWLHGLRRVTVDALGCLSIKSVVRSIDTEALAAAVTSCVWNDYQRGWVTGLRWLLICPAGGNKWRLRRWFLPFKYSTWAVFLFILWQRRDGKVSGARQGPQRLFSRSINPSIGVEPDWFVIWLLLSACHRCISRYAGQYVPTWKICNYQCWKRAFGVIYDYSALGKVYFFCALMSF